MLSNHSIIALQDMLTKVSAGNELANAIQNGCTLSSDTMKRLVVAVTKPWVANDLQAAILGAKPLSIIDVQYLVDATASALVAGDVISNLAAGLDPNAQNLIKQYINLTPSPLSFLANTPASIGTLPAGSSLVNSQLNGLRQTVITLPAASAFPVTGPGSYFTISNAGSKNFYAIWYNVSGAAPTAQAAQADAHSAYTSLSTMTSTPISATLDGQTLTPGVYSAGAPHLATSGAAAMTFNGAGVYVIIASSTLTTGAGGAATMNLTGGALAKNIYWVVGSSATINS